jgi:hypothetical protein
MKDMTTVQNKVIHPVSNKTVAIKIKPGRAVEGVGGPGEVVNLSASEAERIVAMGYADYVKE